MADNFFSNLRDRDDFFIALAVLGFFTWLMWQYGFGDRFTDGESSGLFAEVSEIDLDGDGIVNAQDACPELKGKLAYRGCPGPASLRDAEEMILLQRRAEADREVVVDQLRDNRDELALRDSDDDGVLDAYDRCPYVAGRKDNFGCPEGTNFASVGTIAGAAVIGSQADVVAANVDDRDRDGVTDEIDDCPDEPGLAQTAGCPDQDNDGIADKDDACPITAGSPTAQGCPDSDRDGIPNKTDECIEEPGIAPTGCPDYDDDGLAGSQDLCPREAGTEINQGCPTRAAAAAAVAATTGIDSDGDGVLDSVDRCPNEIGPVKLDGCPDTDNDGTPDIYDNCPKRKGPIVNKGCPEVEFDEDERQLIRDAVRDVKFELDRSRLKATAIPVLDKIVGLMGKYPSYQLSIEGHASADAAADYNLQLSRDRANSVFDYLVSKGIDRNRLKREGYGETRLKDKKNPRSAVNRRVEFDFYEKD